MFFLFQIVACAIIATASSVKSDQEVAIPIIRQIKELNPDGTYSHAFETKNEIFAEERGYLKNAGDRTTESQVAHGQYQFQTPEGIIIRTVYTADENGFRPQGNHLPVGPPIPPLIVKSLRYLGFLP